MKRQDKPVSPCSYTQSNGDVIKFIGETKREKAFWMVYSALLRDEKLINQHTLNYIAEYAKNAIEAGFERLYGDIDEQ